MKFFNHCTTLEEVKTTYKQLAMQHHPDRGGDKATMQAINAEYAYASACILKGAGLSEEETEQQIKFSEEYQQVIEKIIFLPDIAIELVGLWIWVTGKTRPVKEQLKAAGLFYASKKMAWYYRSEDFKVKKGGKKTLDEIRDKYGSQSINTQYRPTLAASSHR